MEERKFEGLLFSGIAYGEETDPVPMQTRDRNNSFVMSCVSITSPVPDLMPIQDDSKENIIKPH